MLETQTFDPLTYVTAGDTPIRSEPSPTSKTITSLRVLTLANVVDVVPGWIKIRVGDDKPDATTGWVQGVGRDVIFEDVAKASERLSTVATTTWPIEVKIAVMLKRVGVGFTNAQALAALGEPRLVFPSDLLQLGQTAVWSYRALNGGPGGLSVVFNGERVSGIR